MVVGFEKRSAKIVANKKRGVVTTNSDRLCIYIVTFDTRFAGVIIIGVEFIYSSVGGS